MEEILNPKLQNTGDPSARRKRVVFWGSAPGSTLHFEKWLLWRGIAEAVREANASLLYVAGEEFENSPQAILYELFGSSQIDGIITWDSFVSPRAEITQIQQFIDRFAPIPVVSIEQSLSGAINLLVDNEQGVRDLLGHLTHEHGYEKIAFINQRRNHSSLARQAAFEKIMQEAGLYNPDLIGTLDDLDARGLKAGMDYRAVMVNGDIQAVDILGRLQAMGERIPQDVAITGFNDGREARGCFPPLTTARLPFRRLGNRAVELLIHRIDGETVPLEEVLPMQLILRRSCGCLEPMAEHAAARIVPCDDYSVEALLADKKNAIVRDVARGLGVSGESLTLEWSERIYEAFAVELTSHATQSSPAFLQTLYDILLEAVDEGVNVSRWHEPLSVLRRYLIPCMRGADLAIAEDLFQQARVMVGQAAVRAETHRNWESSKRADVLRDIEAALLISQDFAELFDLLTQSLERLNVPDFYLAQYEGPVKPDGFARLMLAVQNGKRELITEDLQVFPLADILPRPFLERESSTGLVVEALQLRDEPIGYIIFRADPPQDSSECEIYQALRIQLSSAIKSVRLREHLYVAVRQAEEANQLKSRFLSMVSHELRTPLNLIVGLSEMALRQQSKGGKQALEVLRKYHEQIYISGQHLDRLIRDVLDLASSQVGQMKLFLNPVDLITVIQDAVSMGEQLARQKNLLFKSDIPDSLPVVWGDKTRLRQVLLNLISNAIKFTAHGEVELSASQTLEGIQISVRDTGLGIPKDEQELIFDEFQQSDRSLGRGYEGIGLGLAITRRLVELHGGRIWVSSRGSEGSGSTFSFVIPVMKDQPKAQEEPPSDLRSKVVLVLSQDEGSSSQLAGYLSQHGFSVEIKSFIDEEDYIDDITQSPPGAIVLDIAPASEQGWDIMKRLKEDPTTHDIPVLFYSLVAEQDSGAVLEMDYLTKPIGVKELVNALKRHGLRGKMSSQPVILVVDDDPSILDLHIKMIETQLPNGKILTARDGIHALELMRSIRPDLVLLDLLMPELDGFGVLKSMQEEQNLRGIPVVVISGQVLTKREISRLNQGVAAVLGKGLFSTEEIFSKVEAILSRNQRLGSEAQRLVFQAMGFIHERYREPISRSDIAGSLNVNEQYLSRCFNKEIGIGPMVYLSRYRIEQAKRLLESGNMSITQVAMEVGLSSQSYFSRIFQQETGISPSAYQRGYRSHLS